MPKGDDAIRKKKNKVLRKRLNADPSTVPARIAAIIASKQRRKNGKRRMCEGMCFSLPTPEDPFNDGYNKTEQTAKKAKKKVEKKKPEEVKTRKLKNSQDKLPSPSEEIPVKSLFAIKNAFLDDPTFDMGFMANSWGIEFWRCCSAGSDIIGTDEDICSIEQMAWIVATAADVFARKEKEGLSIVTPFLLFLVPSQEEATKVRSVCKPLKEFGIHTVSIHGGVSLDHQIQGLKNCEPEFIISTPERLLELLSLRAIDISGVSLLVIDGLGSLIKDGIINKINSIRETVSGDPQTVIFNNCSDSVSTSIARNLLKRSIKRLCRSDSIASQSAFIYQFVHVCSSEEEKLSKCIQILNEECDNRLSSQLPKALLISGSSLKAQALATSVAAEGYIVSANTSDSSQVATSKKMAVVSIVDLKKVASMDIGGFEVILVVDFPISIKEYVRILKKMARHTVNGVLHSLFSQKDARLARPLAEVLEQCSQVVPETLKSIIGSSSPMVEN